MSENPAGMPAAADNPMAAQQPPAAVASTEGVDVAAIEEALRDVIDPELGINVVDLGLLYGVSDRARRNGRARHDPDDRCLPVDRCHRGAGSAGSVPHRGQRPHPVGVAAAVGPDKITPEGREQLRALGFNV